MAALTDTDSAALRAYSAGEIGWREACRRLHLLNGDELAEMLAEHGLSSPPEPEEDTTAARLFADFVLRGEQG